VHTARWASGHPPGNLCARYESVTSRHATTSPAVTDGAPRRLVRYLASSEPGVVTATTADTRHALIWSRILAGLTPLTFVAWQTPGGISAFSVVGRAAGEQAQMRFRYRAAAGRPLPSM